MQSGWSGGWQPWARGGVLLGVLLLMLTALPTALPTQAVGTPNYTGADALLANGPWPTRGRTYTHQGRATVAGPASLDGAVGPFTRDILQLNIDDPGADPTREKGTNMRGAFLGEGGTLIAAGAFTGVFEINWAGGRLERDGQFYTCCGGSETWVEDATIGRGNAVYLAHEGGSVRKLVKVGSGASARWSDQQADCTPAAGCGWRKDHGFMHAPPALFPYRLPGDPAGQPDRTAVLVMSPNGYVAALRAEDGAEMGRFRYMNGTGNKEGAREKGFTWSADGTIYFMWGKTLFALDPIKFLANDPSPLRFSVPLGVDVSAGPVLVEGPGDDYLYASGNGTFFQVNLTTRAVRRFGMGSSPLDRNFYPRMSFERWPAVSADGNTIYYTASNSLLYAMDRATWQPRWVHKVDAGGGWGGGIKSDPLVDSQGIIYVYAADQHAYAIDPRDGSRLWKFGMSGASDSFYPGTELALGADGTLYVATSGGGRNLVWAIGRGGGGPPPPTATAAPPTATAPATTATPTTPPTATPTPTTTPVPPGTPAAGARVPIVGVIAQSATTAASAPASNLYDTGTSPQWTRWSSNWLSGPGELSAVLDLGGDQSIGSLRYFVADGGLARDLSFAASSSPTGPWTTVAAGLDGGTVGNVWKTAAPGAPVTGRYLRIVITGGPGRLGGLGELQVYAP